MTSMFGNCSSLTSLDVSNFDTSKVTSINSMFDNCSKLTSLDLSGWDTSSVTDIRRVFALCEKLQNLDISGWVIQNITSTRAIVASCKSLQTLDLSGWDTSQVTDMYYTFNGCSGLQSLDLSGWDVSKVTVTGDMFSICTSLTSLKWTNWCPQVGTDIGSTNLTTDCLKDLLANLATVTDGQTLTLGSTNLAKLSTADILAAQLKGWTLDGATSTAVVFASDTDFGNTGATEVAIQLSNGKTTARIEEVLAVYTSCETIYVFEDGTVPSLINLFSGVGGTYRANIKNIMFLPGYFKNATTFASVFSGWTGLEYVDMAGCITSKVANISAMFHNCASLKTIDGLGSCDTSGVKDFSGVFRLCGSLTSLDVSNWDTSNATNMNGVFENCSKLTSLDVSNWNTSSVNNMSSIFKGCSGITSLDLSNWDTSNVTSMGNMFHNCSELTSLDVSNFDTSKVTNIASMFDGCSKLTSIDMSGWDVTSLTWAVYLFYGCSSLQTIDLTGWSTTCSMDNNVFNGCGNLTSLKWGPNWKSSTGLDACNKLTTESLKDLLANLATVTDGQTLRLGSTNLAKLTDSEKAIATNKGWTLS